MQYEGNTNNYVDLHILAFGAYEKHILYFLRDVMESTSPNHGVFIDVGANTGQHSLFMSGYAREVHAFEPYEPVLQRFRRMIEINHIRNIKIYPVGLGNKDAKIPFFKPPEVNQGTGSFVEGFYEQNSNYKELEIVVGDEALEKAGVSRADVFKIDVEGYEKPVLQGLNRTLTTNRPVVHFELTVKPTEPSTFKSREELLSVFPKNYKFLTFDSSSDLYTGFYQLSDLNRIINFSVLSRYDVVAYPAEKENQIPHRSAR
jgi:FkbM family methyltransferase